MAGYRIVVRLTAECGGPPVDGDPLEAAALGIGRDAGAETLTVPSSAAGAGVGHTVHVEPRHVHLSLWIDGFP